MDGFRRSLEYLTIGLAVFSLGVVGWRRIQSWQANRRMPWSQEYPEVVALALLVMTVPRVTGAPRTLLTVADDLALALMVVALTLVLIRVKSRA